MNDHQPIEEKALLLKAAAGDEQAFRDLVVNYSGLLFRFIDQHVNDRPLAEEIVQDIFVKIWLTRETLAHLRNFRAFLFILARNHALNAIKKMMREKNRHWNWLQKAKHTTEEEADRQEILFILLEEAVNKLPPQQQKAWNLCRSKGLKYEQAAAEMQVSRDAVKKYLQYANLAIKKHIALRLPALLL